MSGNNSSGHLLDLPQVVIDEFGRIRCISAVELTKIGKYFNIPLSPRLCLINSPLWIISEQCCLRSKISNWFCQKSTWWQILDEKLEALFSQELDNFQSGICHFEENKPDFLIKILNMTFSLLWNEQYNFSINKFWFDDASVNAIF